MEMIKKEIEVPKYRIESNVDSWLTFEEVTGYVEGEIIKAAFNTNNTGGHNFLGYKELAFEDVYDIKEFANGKPWLVISTYQENGYVGVYTRTGEDALRVRPNNWVEGGRNGLLYVIAGEQEHLDNFVRLLSHYINYGIDSYNIYDSDDNCVDSYEGIDVEVEDLLEWAEPYGFTREDIERVK